MNTNRGSGIEPENLDEAVGDKATAKVTFVRGTERLRAMRERHPEVAEAVAARRAELRQADRDHAMGLAMIRQAANLTQTELAAILGGGCSYGLSSGLSG